jgi:uncharacterized membrane protein
MMVNQEVAPAGTLVDPPKVRTVGVEDLKDALRRGYDDFSALPSHAVFLCIIYPVIGLLLGALMLGYQLLPLLFPLAAGFALVGPVAAIGLYELSRRREKGLPISFNNTLDVFRSRSIGAIVVLAIMLLVLFVTWIFAAQALYFLTFGDHTPATIGEFARQIFTTRSGWTLIIVGNLVGFLFAVVVLSLSVVSFPLLLDRDCSAATAAETSLRTVRKNPKTMAVWGFIIAVALLLGSLPLFIGLAVVLPVLGHATWHLYRKCVEY